MKNLWIITITSVLLMGCSNSSSSTAKPRPETRPVPPSQAQTPAEHTIQLNMPYLVEWIGERPLIDRSHLTVVLGDNNKASGDAGCNKWFGTYQLNGKNITFSDIGTTRKMCAPALMEQEKRFLEALPKTAWWEFSETWQLRLWPKNKMDQPIKLWPDN